MTYEEAYKSAKDTLTSAKIADAKIDALYLMLHYLDTDRTHFFMNLKEEIEPNKFEMIKEALKRRCNHIPLQQIIGYTEFMGHKFKVTDDVLCPRMETEQLILEVLRYLKSGMRVLDLCCGSGCIGISLKLANPKVVVDIADISDEALKVATYNAQSLDADVNIINSNLFDNIDSTYDIIVSNPPYIPTGDIETLMSEVKDHEPILALDGGEDGFDFYKKIIKESRLYLADCGFIFFETGYNQGSVINDLLDKAGFLDVKIIQDLAGYDRIACARFSKED